MLSVVAHHEETTWATATRTSQNKDLFSRTIAKHVLFKAQHYIYMLYRSEDVVPLVSRTIGVSLRGK